MMNLNLLSLSLLLILNSFIHSSNQVDFKNLDPFYCEDIDKTLNYFNNKEKFIFIIRNDNFHLIFNNTQFAFKNFYFGDYDEDQQSNDLIVGNPFSSQLVRNYFVEYDYFGTINNNNQIYLAYKINSKYGFGCSKLDYKSGLIEQVISYDCSKIYKKISFEEFNGFSHYFNKNNSIFLLNYLTDEKKLRITRIIENLKSAMELDIDYEIKIAAIGNIYSNNSKIHYLNLYEIDKNFTIHINLIEARVNDDSTFQEFKFEKRISLNKFNFTNLIGCIDKITDLNQIKGILFKDRKFYLISYRKYWIYELDLIKERFNLNIANLSSVNYLKFNDKVHLSTVEYEIRFSKWIKQLDNEIYFIPYKNSIFEIEFYNDNENSTNNFYLKPKKSDKELLNYCKGSTIRIENDDYCFESTKYFKTKLFKDDGNTNNYENKRYPISDLFKSTPFNYDYDNDKLLFIFKYTDNLIIFITIKSFILIDIKLFDQIDDYLLLKPPKDDNEFFFDDNCLLRECLTFPKSKGKVYPNNSSSNILIVLFVLFIIIILFSICSLIRRKRDDKKSYKLNMKNFNLNNLKDNFSTYFNRQISGFRNSIFNQPKGKSKKKIRNISELEELDSKSQSSRFSFLALKDRLNRKGSSKSSYSKVPGDKLRSTQTFPIFSSKSKERVLRHAKLNQIP